MFPKGLIVGLSMLILAAAVIMVDENSCHAQSQNVPNLSGTWELIEYDGTTKRQLGSRFPQMTLAISQTAAEVKITKKRIIRGVEEVREFTFYPDGRGETNMGRIELWPRNVPKFESVTQWQKDKLLTRYEREVNTPIGGSSWSDTRQEWRLTSAGKTLELRTATVYMEGTGMGRAHSAFPSPGAEFWRRKLVFRKMS